MQAGEAGYSEVLLFHRKRQIEQMNKQVEHLCEVDGSLIVLN